MNIAFIPARGGSKGIPGKNIKLFSGMPLVYWTLSELQKTDLIDKIILATDCESIKKIVKNERFKSNIFLLFSELLKLNGNKYQIKIKNR